MYTQKAKGENEKLKMNINNKQKIVIAAVLIMGGLATFMTMNVMSTQSAVAQVADHRPTPPEPFSIAVNGHNEPAIVTLKRGQTEQIDVLIGPKIAGIIGNVSVQSVRPICGTPEANVISKCIPSGITAFISENTVSATKHMVLTITADPNMPSGFYAYEVTADTTMNVPYQDTPIHVGNISAFGIQVT